MKLNGPLKHALLFAVLLALQVLIFNRMAYAGYISPYVYMLFILSLPIDISGWLLMLLAFGMGLSVDMFSDSLAMHAFSCTLMAFARPGVIRLISVRSDFDPGVVPSISAQGISWIFTYCLLLTGLHHIALFSIEVFSLAQPGFLILRILLSTAFSVLFILAGFFLIDSRDNAR